MKIVGINNAEFTEVEIVQLSEYMKQEGWALIERILQADRNAEVANTLQSTRDLTVAQFAQSQGAYNCLHGLSELPKKVNEARDILERDAILELEE